MQLFNPEFLSRNSLKFFRQADSADCGPTCLRMISHFHGKSLSARYLREISFLDRKGVSLLGISHAAEQIGYRTLAAKVKYENRDHASLLSAPMPCIAHWNQNHFVVIYRVTDKFVWVADPASGKHKLKRSDFERSWTTDAGKGIILLLQKTPDFVDSAEEQQSYSFGFLMRYLSPYKRLILQLSLGLLLSVLFQLLFPFLTQSVVDIGIQNNNLNFIYLILAAQMILFASQTSVQFIQNWILLHISTRINIALISDFLQKLMRLPLGFFDAKNIGDLLQRIGDHKRIESFLTGTTLQVVFSSFSLLVFSFVLFMYKPLVFFIFALGALLYILWIVLFLKKRKEVDYLAFQQLSENQDSLIEIIQGMPEIKLQNSEYKRRWNWANIQARLFKTQIRSLAITQYQDAGASFINQFKDICISFVVATSVIKGEMTLGMMIAVQYIVGQVNGPLNQLIGFIRKAQDAKISLERLNEIHSREGEQKSTQTHTEIVPEEDIVLEDLHFKYSPISPVVLKKINLIIPKGKITAIVGTSGSGKTTLIKLLLGFYPPTSGKISIGGTDLQQIHQQVWRAKCGAVLQDGYIFSDSIANNIAESDDIVDRAQLLKAVKTANIQEHIERLPQKYNTTIGAKGKGLSQGQKQRMLIARAVYKDPEVLFFDEATNALDANNEKVIMENLEAFFKGRTVIVVAHRLSTVKNADQIVVLEQGDIAEIGTHKELVDKRGKYFTLVKNQLELGN